MIEINNLNYTYAGSKTAVFSDFSLTIGEGIICGLLGKNGTGKSTLLKLICGLLQPKKGNVTIDSTAVGERRGDTLAKLFYVPDEIVFPNLSMDSYVKILRPFYPNFSNEVLRDCMDEFEMEIPKKLTRLSLGEKKKVALSIAIAMGTDIVLLDEPTNGLDISSKVQFRKIMAKAMNDKRTILVSTHLVHDIEQMLDHVVIIGKSGLLVDKSTNDLMNEFACDIVPAESDTKDIIYQEPSVGGLAIIRHRKEGENETNISLELLFNYANSKK
ncbi:MAG: ABC transporter ATP-binding protein [Bacteroidales bacterium]|nr:ABC transporter ATP-binding protein [Bacteroidales bacterium]